MPKLTHWFNAKSHSPVREGWYDCKECSARHYFKDGRWYRDKKSLKHGGYMTVYKMHWRGLLEPRPTSWKSFLESDIRATHDFMQRSKEEQAWLDVVPVGREFGSPDFERLMEEDFDRQIRASKVEAKKGMFGKAQTKRRNG